MPDMPTPCLTAFEFQHRLLDWFDQYGRHDLPWQSPRSAYRVWVSEIMLQQTQVATVIPYFERFMARFPTLEALARADQDEVLHLWTGLGYYARARNLHKAAQTALDEHGGELPTQSVETLIALPGIGRSTAGAIIAQSTGARAAILDGNVKRSMTRLHAVSGWPGKPAIEGKLWALAEYFTPAERLADYTQAIMDFGATLCTRARPDCVICPFNDVCAAYKEGAPQRYPESKPKKALPTRETLMLVLRDGQGRVWLEQRPPSGLWGGLWSLPQFDDRAALGDWLQDCVDSAVIEPALPGFTHTFSHFRLAITPQPVRCEGLSGVREKGIWFDSADPPTLGLAAPVKSLLAQLAPFSLDPTPGP
ncbi:MULTISPECIES: A/G-specific adenine glycosylase [unclassified Halomonas]|uniref:A/G-specific adenine glycosylase n=1 Tax=unclassified Halomonas TaxID=2609666 RepID=UPI0020A00572|nr:MULTISPECIES: A/G-specific adenine glycosylase [unclassified Halomonas]MCP1314340.1 A/G-specific adenine glycosylase [Halomonas sp. 707D7]MCP1326813.1 A/G-specific adenine glycosylase [Halomonas sp. 707D4]